MLPWLEPLPNEPYFPPTELALHDPNGLLAAGGALTPDWLIEAYTRGIFPWFNEGDPILWWSPTPRTVFYPNAIHISKSLKKTLRKGRHLVSINRAFDEVISACAEPRADSDETWITQAMKDAYSELHQQGYAHSVEVWLDEQLVGGLYGVCIDRVFFGESMFSRSSDSSKIALLYLANQLAQWSFEMIDCQVDNDHLQRLGAHLITREVFIEHLSNGITHSKPTGNWQPRLLDSIQW